MLTSSENYIVMPTAVEYDDSFYQLREGCHPPTKILTRREAEAEVARCLLQTVGCKFEWQKPDPQDLVRVFQVVDTDFKPVNFEIHDGVVTIV